MKILVLMMALFAGQLEGPQSGSVLRLYPPHNGSIPVSAAGQLVELLNPLPTVSLPHPVPKRDEHGGPWSVEIRNMGSVDVSVMQVPAFQQMGPQILVVLHPMDRTRIRVNGSTYVVAGR